MRWLPVVVSLCMLSLKAAEDQQNSVLMTMSNANDFEIGFAPTSLRNVTVSEGVGVLELGLQLVRKSDGSVGHGGSSDPLTVSWQAFGTVSAPNDVAATSGVTSISAGVVNTSISFAIVDDDVWGWGAVKHFRLYLIGVTGGAALMTSRSSSGSINVTDNDSPPSVSISSLYLEVTAGDRATVRLLRQGWLGPAVQLRYVVFGSGSSGTDYSVDPIRRGAAWSNITNCTNVTLADASPSPCGTNNFDCECTQDCNELVNCSGHGRCSGISGACICDHGWIGNGCGEQGYETIITAGSGRAYINITTFDSGRESSVQVRVVLNRALAECVAFSNVFDCPVIIQTGRNSSLINIGRYAPPTTSGISSTTLTPISTTPAPALPPCAAGETGPAGDCTACEAGKFKASTGSEECAMCEPGSYQNSASAYQCELCDVGKFSNSTGAIDGSTCTWCMEGKYSSSTGLSACISCVKGTYSPTVGANDSSTCLPCGSGTYSSSVGAYNSSTCEVCEPGKYMATTGASSCHHCQEGKFGKESGSNNSADCLSCAPNTYADTAGASHCTVCPVSPGGRQTSSGPASSSIGNCTNDLLEIYASASASSNITVFEVNIDKYKEGIAATANVVPASIEIVSYSQVNSSQTSRRLLSGVLSVVFNFRIQVPRYFSSQAEAGLSDLNAWVQEQGLPGVTVGITTTSCGAGAEPDPSNMFCQACAVGMYKNASDNSSCVGCPMLSSTISQGAFLISQCQCVPGFYSTHVLAFNVSCSECGVGYFCSGGLHRSLCPERMELPSTSATSSSCRCSPGYEGPDLGPCVCQTTSNRFLEIRVNSSLASTGVLHVGVINISNSSEGTLCGDGGAGCVPFTVFYTLDGSMPNAGSSRLCPGNGWRADECRSLWRSSMTIYFVGVVQLRAIALRQGYHPDVCLEFGSDVSAYQIANSSIHPESHTAGLGSPNSASVECNVPIEFRQSFAIANITPPAPRVAIFPSFAGSPTEASDQNLTCTCTTALCCYAETFLQRSMPSSRGPWMRANGTGTLKVVLTSTSLVMGSPHQIQYRMCEAPAPAFPLGNTVCTPSGAWKVYQDGVPLEVSTRSFVTAFAITGQGVPGEEITFQVPVRLLVHSSPVDSSSVAVGSTIQMMCGDERTQSFQYSFSSPSHMVDDRSGWEPESLSLVHCRANGKAAVLSWPFVESTSVTVKAVDGDGETVCEARTFSFSTSFGDPQRSDPVCPIAIDETQKLLAGALKNEASSGGGGGGGGSDDSSSSAALEALGQTLSGDDDKLAFLEALVRAGVLSNSSAASLAR